MKLMKRLWNFARTHEVNKFIWGYFRILFLHRNPSQGMTPTEIATKEFYEGLMELDLLDPPPTLYTEIFK